MRNVKATASKPATATTRAVKPRAIKTGKPALVVATTEPEPVATPAPEAPAAAPAAAKPVAGLTRTAATVTAQRYPFGSLSSRDEAYITFFAGFAKRDATVTLETIVSSGARPNAVSNKPNDAGVIIRLHKAGIIAASDDGKSFTFTERGATLAAYAAG